MKNKITTLLIFASLLFATSCDSFLDKNPISEYSMENYYKSPAQLKSALTGTYNQLQSVMRVNFAYWGEGRADNVKIRHTGETMFLLDNNLNASNVESANWASLYTLIARANAIIKYAPNVYTPEQSEGNQIIGEARALRALAYFTLVKVWGDVPLITEPYTSPEDNVYVTKTDKEQVLKQILEDLKFAAANCSADKNNAENNRVTFTRGGANGLLTQVYMWQHNYDEAIKTADLVLGNPLYTLEGDIVGWSKIFTENLSRESIFEVGYNDTQTNGLRTLYAQGNDAQYTPSEKFKASMEAGDLRREYIYDVTATEPGAIWKYLGKGVSDEDKGPSKQNIVLVRLADIILLKAEALNKKGQSAEALKLMEPIRKRAGLTPTLLTAAQAATMYGSVEDAILHERSMELCYEGHRWFDLVRTGKAISTMKPINGLSDEANLVWPIHIKSLNGNANLVQNSFYN